MIKPIKAKIMMAMRINSIKSVHKQKSPIFIPPGDILRRKLLVV